MKKLTKRVQAGGLWFDVPSNVNYLAFNENGDVIISQSRLVIAKRDGKWFSADGEYYLTRYTVDLEGADWRDCCWFVGDQTGNETEEPLGTDGDIFEPGDAVGVFNVGSEFCPDHLVVWTEKGKSLSAGSYWIYISNPRQPCEHSMFWDVSGVKRCSKCEIKLESE